MYHKILETDEAIKDLHHISCEAYDFTKDTESGFAFLRLYDAATANIVIFPNGFSSTSMEYREYVIHILPFGNYKIFILCVLYQKQNWQRILRVNIAYHIYGEKI